MATLGATMPNLVDVVKATGPDGKILRCAELLSQLSPVINDMPMREGNLATGHRVQVRTSLPTPTSRRFNQRVLPTKATSEQNDEQMAQLVDYSQVDCSVADLNGNGDEFRMQQAIAHLAGLTNEFERQAWYGNSAVVQEEMDGLLTRLTTAGDTVIDAGGSGADNSSIVLVGWGLNTCYGFYGKGMQGGIKHESKGKITSEDANGLIEVYRDRWELNAGIAVEDPRFLGAVRAIDVSSTVADPTGATVNLMTLMLKMVHGIYDVDSPMIKPVIYMNRTIFQMLDIQAQNKTNVYLQAGNEEGRPKLSFRGIPIHVSDALTETEATI